MLEDPQRSLTVFAPTNEAVTTTLNSLDLDLAGLLKQPALVAKIVEYHLLPDGIPVRIC